jgi:hypothetical protein
MVQSAPRTMRKIKGERRVCEFISGEDLDLTFNQVAALVVWQNMLPSLYQVSRTRRYQIAATRGFELPPRAMWDLRIRRTSSIACAF